MATELGSRGTPETDLKEPIEALLTVVPQLARSIDTLNKSVTRIDRNVSTLDSNVTMLRTSLEAMVGCFTATVEVFVDRTNEQAAAFRRVHDIYTGFVEDQRRGGQTTKTVHKLLNLDYRFRSLRPGTLLNIQIYILLHKLIIYINNYLINEY